MMSMHVPHEPFNMKEVMGNIKPCIEDEHIDKNLFN